MRTMMQVLLVRLALVKKIPCFWSHSLQFHHQNNFGHKPIEPALDRLGKYNGHHPQRILFYPPNYLECPLVDIQTCTNIFTVFARPEKTIHILLSHVSLLPIFQHFFFQGLKHPVKPWVTSHEEYRSVLLVTCHSKYIGQLNALL